MSDLGSAVEVSIAVSLRYNFEHRLITLDGASTSHPSCQYPCRAPKNREVSCSNSNYRSQ